MKSYLRSCSMKRMTMLKRINKLFLSFNRHKRYVICFYWRKLILLKSNWCSWKSILILKKSNLTLNKDWIIHESLTTQYQSQMTPQLILSQTVAKICFNIILSIFKLESFRKEAKNLTIEKYWVRKVQK